MAIATMMHDDVEVAQRICSEGLPEVFDQFAVEFADLLCRELGTEDHEVTAAEVDRGGDERLFHRKREMSVASNALLVTDCLLDRLAQADSDVLDRVVLVDVEVTVGSYLQVEYSVPREEFEHMVEEADACFEYQTRLCRRG